jgi:hypothetical protein
MPKTEIRIQWRCAVSLTGSLETFSLPDVLTLLASTAKTGELSVHGDRLTGRLWVAKGKLVGQDVARAETPTDAIFELLRLPAGTFSFDADGGAPAPGDPVDVTGVLGAAKDRLTEWRGIEKVVPSLEAIVRMSPTAPGPEVSVRDDQWRLLVAAGSGRSVASMMQEAEARLVEVVAKPVAKVAPRRERTRSQQPEAAPKEERPVPSRNGAASWAEAQPATTTATAVAVAVPAPDEPAAVPAKPAPDLDALVQIPQRLRGQSTDQPEPATDPESVPRRVRPAAGGQAAAIRAAASQPLEQPADPAEDFGDEPINRGLLLKFLSSVRN